ncbi:MAG: GDP-L-fucose synthase [Candidatus Brocadia sp.]|nr:MAG: GDP-L-fucose synthase [Candidatus Brocadia sp.]
MDLRDRIYVAGHRGLVGSALVSKLQNFGFTNIIIRTHKELDLTRQSEVETFFKGEKPEFVFLAAAKVGGILANSTYKAEFIYQNIMIATNIIHASYKYGVRKLLNLGSSCIYPKFAPQPMREEFLLMGSLEPTNEPYAIAKISAIKLCRFFNEQYGTNFLSVMPTNLYGINDNFDLKTSHVLPALIRKMHLGKCLQKGDFQSIRIDLQKRPISNHDVTSMLDEEIINLLSQFGIKYNFSKIIQHSATVVIWGTGSPYREFLHVDDLADACIFLMEKYNAQEIGEFVNIGTGEDNQIKDLANMIKEIVNYQGKINWDTTKPDGMPKKLLDISKMKALGWRPKITLKDGIKRVYAWYLEKLSTIDEKIRS